MRRVSPGPAALVLAVLAPCLVACSDDTSSGVGGASSSTASGDGGADGATTGGGGSDGGADASSTSISTSSSTTSAGGDGGGGAGGGGLAPWDASIERCDGATDDDGDGRVDEDCSPSLFSGVFVPAGTGLTDPTVLDHLETDVGATVPVIQTYRSTSTAGAANARADLEAIWARGSVPHLNVEPLGYTPGQFVAAGDDPELAADVEVIATTVAATLADHPEGRVLLTFGAEMNGDWTDWGCLAPATFITFYRWAHGVFADALVDAGIDPRRVRWVFGPNNVSSAGCGSAADYYPGHAYTDFLGMSSYRSGTQSIASAVVDPAHDLLDDLAYPAEWQADRFIVLQTGTRDEPGDDRDAWIRDLWSTLADDPVFRGVIYFDAADWSVIDGGDGVVDEKPGYQGLVDAVAAAPSPDARLEGTFDPFFWDVRFGHPSYPEVQSLRAAGLSSGCGSAPPRFCPDAALTRADAAVLIGRAFALEPLAPASASFDDVPADHPAFGLVEAAAALGLIAPCADGAFCPAAPVLRGDLARALVRVAAIEGAPGAPSFTDLGATGEDGAIQLLASVGHVDGCAAELFCPDDDVLRHVGARWIVRTGGVAPAPAP